MKTRGRSLVITFAVGAAILAAVVSQTVLSAPAPAQVVTVEMKEYAYVPKTITIKPGAARFIAVNKGIVEHNFIIVGVKGATSGIVKPGKTGTFDTTLAAKTYQIICDVPGHKEAGMVGTLVVK